MTVKVVTEDELAAVQRRVDDLELQLRQLVAGGIGAARREYLTPKQVARAFKVGDHAVYDALRDGKLAAEKRPGNGREVNWRIKHDDARRWYDAFVRGEGNT